MGGVLQAEEQSGNYDEWGNWIEGSAYPDDSYFGEAGLENTDALAALTDGFSQDSANASADIASLVGFCRRV